MTLESVAHMFARERVKKVSLFLRETEKNYLERKKLAVNASGGKERRKERKLLAERFFKKRH